MKNTTNNSLEKYFKTFRNNIIGINEVFKSPFGSMPLIYADWTASGRLYAPIEDKIKNDFGIFVANTHTKTTISGSLMTSAYEEAREIIKKHVNASKDDILIMTGNGMTGAVNKFQRILGLKIHEKYKDKINIRENERPIVFITHMEHHSNQTSWLETIADVEIIPYYDYKNINWEKFKELLQKYKSRELIIASVTGCSNVTGIVPEYKKIAKLIHEYNGYCFVDFACSAPYVDIDMHPMNSTEQLDAIFFSPHKFLGGPGSNGVLIFNKNLYKNKIPDNPGGGTVLWTNPWKEHAYFNDIEMREDGGTPGFLQTIRVALSIKLKEQMGVDNILKREHEILDKLIPAFKSIDNLNLLADNFTKRLGVLSFIIDDLPNELGVKLLNDHFGIQTRGGCSCAGTYGHILLDVNKEKSKKIVKEIEAGDTSNKPGWIRLSIHPTTTDEEVKYIIKSIEKLIVNHKHWQQDYTFDKGEYVHKNYDKRTYMTNLVKSWFNF